MIVKNRTYGDVWQMCLSQIKEQTSDEEFSKWFKPIVPLDFDGTTLKLRVPNESYVYHIEKHFIPLLTPIIHQQFGLKTKLRYAVPQAEQPASTVVSDADMTAINTFATQTNTTNIKNPFVIPGIRKLVIDPQLNPNYTFDTFVEGDCNRLCRSAGFSVAVDPGATPFNPLYIYGDSGLGKTHIAQAIGMEAKQRRPSMQVLYVSMNKFQAQFTNAVRSGEIKWGLSAQLQLPDLDTKVKIIRNKALRLGADVPDEVVDFLADNINANVREIEGALSSLVANASFLGKKITVTLAKEILKVYVQFTQKEITIDHIQKVVCEYLGLPEEKFKSPRRTREIAQARQIAMYLSKQHTKAPLTIIGASIGGKNHATVLHACKAISNLMETDKVFRHQIEEIEKRVLAK